MSTIRILSGSYRNQPVAGEVFTLVKGFQTGKKGNYVTVKNEGQFAIAINEVKVKVDCIDDIEFLNGEQVVSKAIEFKTKAEVPAETEEVAMDRIAERFSILDEMARACISGDIRAMIVAGPPGVGKSYGVETQMEKASMFDKIAGKKVRFNIVKGAMTALGLYAQLYKYSDSKNVLIFDDCDSVLKDPVALNLLKGALDSYGERWISWNADFKDDDLPKTFKFTGTIVFISNMDLDRVDQAVKSRAMCVDLSMTQEQKVERMETLVADPEFLSDYHMQLKQDAIAFIRENMNRVSNLSLRSLIATTKIRAEGGNWKQLAKYVLTQGA